MWFIAFFLLSFNLQASEPVVILASDSIPPYVMASEQPQWNLPGLQVEIVDAAFNEFSIKTSWQYMTNNRIVVQFVKPGIDAGLNIAFMNSGGAIFESEPIINYKNCVIGRSSIKESWLKNLNKLKILGHQRAQFIYQKIFGSYDFKNKNYNEVTNQRTLAYHAVSHRADIVLSDALVLSYYAKKYFEAQYLVSDLVCLKVIQSPRTLGFKTAKLRDQFNSGLKKIKSNGLYKKILDKYYGQFSSF
ncbi:MAG: hypothetical protein COW01_06995 [Bdellovibrionales bacterium CG12_big_fil_rev_8_21_14_0_65_38_15]|nr:MAG: hypothetical protein COW79_13675 [Bdellovibrionales bacterium CG22_combo_CG10-13_8_21_14_all_38_13]PIQ55715.1 MAG: hypothetical protein COW01_06995 [Bdellovibrionales bacterium CG12_big_fil_rev_8_21_14_0_65_38_15]PIR30725.1 MAG: hypothetical protein COV38_04305 [Bdellovibrionales bacterium CG11_big_fil_rev_8_21_14_0_20_38_13]